jgi:hypothetical protein
MSGALWRVIWCGVYAGFAAGGFAAGGFAAGKSYQRAIDRLISGISRQSSLPPKINFFFSSLEKQKKS